MHHYKQLFAVAAFLGLLFAVFQVLGLRENFSLTFLHQKFLDNTISGMLIFILLFSLGNLIQIPGWVFLAAAVLALGQVWGGVVTYIVGPAKSGLSSHAHAGGRRLATFIWDDSAAPLPRVNVGEIGRHGPQRSVRPRCCARRLPAPSSR